MNISDEAVEAAAIAHFNNNNPYRWDDMEPRVHAECLVDMRAALEAAAPYMLAGVIALSDQWEAEGEQSMTAAKKIPNEEIATALLMDGATMIENARHIRNAIGATK